MEGGIKLSTRTKADVVLLNWPQAATQQKLFIMIRRVVALLVILLVQRARGAQIIWIVHNSHNHDSVRPEVERIFMWFVVSLITGAVFLTEGSRPIGYGWHPKLARLPYVIMPHPVYGDAYPRSPERTEARVRFGIASNRLTLGLVGDLKSYKGVDGILNAVEKMQGCDVDVLLAGAVSERGLAARIENVVERSASTGRSVTHVNHRLDDEELIAALAALDLLVLPYSCGENSGMAILAAEHGTPILARSNPSIDELSITLGAMTVQKFYGRLEDLDLAAAVQNARRADFAKLDRFKARHSSKSCAQALAGLFTAPQRLTEVAA
ncbi:glycosyltransferase [Sphingomonas sp. 37zxx]|uniref:glycosyltransferase n=1 Tax=Sphingomonas sp. 37zxx TaxID=1550073 RepID=UPI000AF6446F|nr:glycosyltransferase [Sphingomonas sp. 37zxx]